MFYKPTHDLVFCTSPAKLVHFKSTLLSCSKQKYSVSLLNRQSLFCIKVSAILVHMCIIFPFYHFYLQAVSYSSLIINLLNIHFVYYSMCMCVGLNKSMWTMFMQMSTKAREGAKFPGIRVTGLACSLMWVVKTESSSFVTVESVLKQLNQLSNPSLLLLKIMSLLSTLVFMATCSLLHRIINV